MPPLKAPIHVLQQTWGYCLPACAQMALAQLGIEVTQRRLAETLGTRAGIGTTFSNIERLKRWAVEVQVAEWIGAEALETAQSDEIAIIAAVVTSPQLPGWDEIRTRHTVVVVAVNADQAIYHDPALDYGPVSASRDEFLLAWSEMSELTALIRHR